MSMVLFLVCLATPSLCLWIFTYNSNLLSPQFCLENTFHDARSIQMLTLLQSLFLDTSTIFYRKLSFSTPKIITKFFKSLSYTCSIINFSMSMVVFLILVFWDSWKQSYTFHTSLDVVGIFYPLTYLSSKH